MRFVISHAWKELYQQLNRHMLYRMQCRLHQNFEMTILFWLIYQVGETRILILLWNIMQIDSSLLV